MKLSVCHICESHTALYDVDRWKLLVCFTCAKTVRDYLMTRNMADNNPFFYQFVMLGHLARYVRFKGNEFIEVWGWSDQGFNCSTPYRIKVNEYCKGILGLDN